MRIFIGAVLYLAACLPLELLAIPDTVGIKFIETEGWQEIKERAKRENKYIFVDCYATWCAPCKRMEEEVYCNDTVGTFMNMNFISAKVQMDTSVKDNATVRRWYKDARTIERTYHINTYPTFLFFSPKGEVIYKSAGFKTVFDFIKLGKQALSPETQLYYSNLEAYKAGEIAMLDLYKVAKYAQSIGETKLARQIALEYIARTDKSQLLSTEKILFVNDVAGNRGMADSLAGIYKSRYLDKLSNAELCRKEYILFIGRFLNQINPQGNFFRLFYCHPTKVDSLMGYSGYSKEIIKYIIRREELDSKLWRNRKPVFEQPDWGSIISTIRHKYPKAQVDEIVADYQIQYFRKLKDSTKVTKLLIDRIDKYGPYDPVYEFNTSADFMWNNAAWMIFEFSDDKFQLFKALTWIDSAIAIATRNIDKSSLSNWMDTKANILYKLGRVDEAINLENRAMALAPESKKMRNTLEKMKMGIPTWSK